MTFAPALAGRLLPLLATTLLFGLPSAQAAKPVIINDTGVTRCVDPTAPGYLANCKGTGQDAEFGRDVTAPASSNGRFGFSFRKMCNSGEVAGTGACLANAPLGSGADDWGCTQDVVTGLIWELKTDDGGVRDWQLNYDTSEALSFAATINSARLCGATNWRLPTRKELQGLIDFAQAWPGPAIDTKWFPNTPAYWYWTSTPWADDAGYVWAVAMSNGRDGVLNSGNPLPVRLVSTGR